jgi:hypothetical protein
MAIKILGRFEILGEIGSGGMGIVYKGRDPKINRMVALKVVRPALGSSKSADQEQAISRFHVEAQAAGQLSHPSIVTIYDVGEEVTPEGTLVYIAMEFVSGKGLDHHIANKTFVTLEQKIAVIKQIAEGLDYAHKRGVVHRDVKPANVIITDEGIPKLTDFGLARLSDSSLTMSGTILGTPNYMSPEQVQGKKVDARSDFFSLTVVLYELLTNEKPFAAESITSVIYKVVHEEPVPPRRLNANLPPMLDAFVRKGLAKNPDSRFQSGSDYLKGLNAVMSGEEKDFNILGDTTLMMDSKSSPIPLRGGPGASPLKMGKGAYTGLGIGLVAIMVLALIFSGGKKKQEQTEQPAAPSTLVAVKAPEGQVPPATPSIPAKPAVSAVSPAPPQVPAAEPKKDLKTEKKEEPAAKPAAPTKPEPEKKEESSVKPPTPAKPEPEKKPVKEGKEAKKEEKLTSSKAPTVTPKEEGMLSISSEPSGGEVFIDDKFAGLSPINSFKHRQGELNLRVTKPGYQTYTKKITLEDKLSFTVALLKNPEKERPSSDAASSHDGQSPAPAPATGGLDIYAPAESVIYVDGREFKETRVELKDLSPGTHLVYVQFKGKSPYTNRVNIKAGETLKVDLR